MAISSEQLREMLRGIIERTPYISDYIKTTDGRVVRFHNWRKASRS